MRPFAINNVESIDIDAVNWMDGPCIAIGGETLYVWQNLGSNELDRLHAFVKSVPAFQEHARYLINMSRIAAMLTADPVHVTFIDGQTLTIRWTRFEKLDCGPADTYRDVLALRNAFLPKRRRSFWRWLREVLA